MIDKDIILNLTDIEISCLEIVSCNFETQADIEKELYRISELCKTLSNELRDRIQEDE
jgi:predicted small metal-binding protein